MSDRAAPALISPYAPDEWGWLWDEPPSRSRAVRSVQLGARQREQLAGVLARRRGPVKVVLYTMASSESAISDRLEHARAYALSQGWQIAGAFSDDPDAEAPEGMPGWAKASSAVTRGFANGILTLDRSSLSITDDDVYETVLDWLNQRGSFLAHVPSEWRPSGPRGVR
ncbi:serine integrase family protein [Actinacidiphila paucisporea]|uniref:Resolvase/invertase-type recombinase catalytic domain-containing protein n=1 Tax=Actinacidiphila paucisporea TaxID=310782 RepID=A0A1M6YKQ1_9ACTN|nr:hypothetical protein [Actinacidiphila paucisporea]SHL18662.1 hypothetical protein SAMN05216499_10322 [Actinacidiphila paucisporea]